MGIADAFGSFNKPGAGLFTTAIVGLILIGIQAILDNNFECPSSKYSPVLAGFYSMSFFLCPAIIFAFLGLIYFPGAKKHWCPCWSSKHTFFYVTIQILKPPVIWLLIAMTDGRFLACFVFAVSRYTVDYNLYLYIFQTSGMLLITLLVILSYIVSKLPCDIFSENKRTYRVLDDVESILKKEKKKKQKEEDKQKFLTALRQRGEFQSRKLPQYMLEAEQLLCSKLQANTCEKPKPKPTPKKSQEGNNSGNDNTDNSVHNRRNDGGNEGGNDGGNAGDNSASNEGLNGFLIDGDTSTENNESHEASNDEGNEESHNSNEEGHEETTNTENAEEHEETHASHGH